MGYRTETEVEKKEGQVTGQKYTERKRTWRGRMTEKEGSTPSSPCASLK